MKTLLADFGEGAWQRTPPLFTALGMCPALAVTTAAQYGLVMGLATTFVLALSATIISLCRKVIPKEVRIPVFTITVATLVTVADLVLSGFLPAVHRVLGIYIPLIVVNCIILGRIEAFSSQHAPHRALTDALGYGLGFTWALTLIGGLRELFAAGTVFNVSVMPAGFTPWTIMQTPPGAFITMGLLVATITGIRRMFDRQRQPAKSSALTVAPTMAASGEQGISS